MAVFLLSATKGAINLYHCSGLKHESRRTVKFGLPHADDDDGHWKLCTLGNDQSAAIKNVCTQAVHLFYFYFFKGRTRLVEYYRHCDIEAVTCSPMHGTSTLMFCNTL